MTSQLVIGAGEVGRAIAEVLDVPSRDLEDTWRGERHEVLHICFPWSGGFEAAVNGYRLMYRPELTVIHSTVPVGTSRRLDAVHSPVTGRHPNLAESIRTFVKFFGGDQATEAAALFEVAGIRTATAPSPETTEAGKLWQTLQFGMLVAIQKEAYAFMRSAGADPDIAYRAMNEAYGEGYAALGESFRLPVIRDMPGPIGGHCVMPNARITDNPIADLLLELDAGYQRPEVSAA